MVVRRTVEVLRTFALARGRLACHLIYASSSPVLEVVVVAVVSAPVGAREAMAGPPGCHPAVQVTSWAAEEAEEARRALVATAATPVPRPAYAALVGGVVLTAVVAEVEAATSAAEAGVSSLVAPVAAVAAGPIM